MKKLNPFSAPAKHLAAHLSLGIFLAGGGLLLAHAALVPLAQAATASLPRLPIIQQVGVVPVQWEGQGIPSGLEAAQGTLTKVFSEAVRNSRRFRVLSDDLVSGLWQSADGREELRSQFEIHAFASLSAVARGDTINLSARLMDNHLRTFLFETDTITANWLQNANTSALKDRVEKLVFRLFNRIPIDVSVTSVQGSYITLSGGDRQGVEAGDRVELLRTRVKTLHPANGTWLAYESQSLGTAQIIDVKTHTSVAKLMTLTYENAVEVGDGAKIPQIASRVKFARLAQNSGFKDSGEPETIIVPPLYTSPPSPAAGDQTSASQQLTPPSPDQKASAAPHPALNSPPPASADEGSMWSDFSFDEISKKIVDDVTVQVGAHWWSIKGPANAAGKFPLWLANSIGVSVNRTLVYKIKLGFGGGVLFGGTTDGRYLGYDSHARIYYEDLVDSGTPLLKTFKVGGLGRFSGLAVEDEGYGGGDWIRGGGFAALGGSFNLENTSTRYDWFGEFAAMSLDIGRLGYKGRRYTVESTFGWKLTLGAFKFMPSSPIQWGGAFEMFDERVTLSNGRRPHIAEYSLLVLGKYQF